MNNKIKELMLKAGTDTSGKWMGVEHAEKFAELLIRKCCDIADEVERADMDSYVSKFIRAHFGVEK